MDKLPTIGSKWRHHNGNEYTVMLIANFYSERPEKYPVTVVYRGQNDKIWSRPLSLWYASMTPVSQPDKPKCACCGTTENLHEDLGSGGPYRCSRPDCIVY